MIKNLFSIPIYRTHFDCPSNIMEGMMRYAEEFYYKNKEDIEGYGGLTGDQDIPKYFLLQHNKEFYWLNYVISQSMKDYLSQISDLEYDIFVQKAWTTVCNLHEGRTSHHSHRGSHFSAVYYLRTEGEGGELAFSNPGVLDSMPITLKDEYSYHKIDPQVGDLIIFPSSMLHGVTDFYGEQFRASIVYDIFVTSTENVDDQYENVVTSPSKWIQI